MTQALARPGAQSVTLERGKALFAASILSQYRGDYRQTLARGEESLAVFRELGFKQGVVWSLNAVATARLLEGDFAGIQALYQESLAATATPRGNHITLTREPAKRSDGGCWRPRVQQPGHLVPGKPRQRASRLHG